MDKIFYQKRNEENQYWPSRSASWKNEQMKLKLAPCKRGGEVILVEEESKRINKKKCRAKQSIQNKIELGEEE